MKGNGSESGKRKGLIVTRSRKTLWVMTKALPDPTPDPTLRGYLVIYVDGYKMYDKYLVHAFSDGANTITVPDRLMPPPDYEVGSGDWWYDGWAVGDNARGRLCKRARIKPLRQFKHYDGAVGYMFARQRKHRDQRHTLVYVTTGLTGKEQCEVVRTLDDIAAIEAQIADEIAANEAAIAEQRAATDVEFPYLRVLQEKHGRSKGWGLSYFLKDIREKGAEAVKASMATSTYYRQIKRLREAGVEI